ncbi:MAG TPA: hypothetical protein VFE01_04765 [Terracidiphilus sp.]|jgi:hypothetical protein|nr:hypothetical protein [Terracidiphilus sp.]
MKTLLLASAVVVGLSGSAAFATVQTSAVNGSASPAMASDVGQRPAMAGVDVAGSGGFAPGGRAAPLPATIPAKPTRVDPPSLFSSPWDGGGSG